MVFPLDAAGRLGHGEGFCPAIAEAMAADRPDRYTATWRRAARRGRIFVDYLRNGLRRDRDRAPIRRARAQGAPVSVPLAWDELGENIRASNISRCSIFARRLEFESADPWADFFKVKQKLPELDAQATRRTTAAAAPARKRPATKKTAGKKAPAKKSTPRKAARKAPARKRRRAKGAEPQLELHAALLVAARWFPLRSA